jgi:protein O-mannosyl-transferase
MAKAKHQPNSTAKSKNPTIAKTAPATPAPSLLPGPKWFGWLVAAIGAVLYINTYGHDFCLDDFGAIKDNWVVKGGISKWGTLFSTEYRYGSWASPGSLYRPLTLAMFSLEWMVQEGPFMGHIMNVFWYAVTGWVLWATWRRILGNYPWTLAAATVVLFMAHPIHTEVVANIKSRDEIISLLGSTLALYFVWRHLERNESKYVIFALLSYGLGMFAKESGITFLAIFPLTLWFFGKIDAGRILRISAMFLIPAGIFLLIRHNVLGKQNYKEVYSILDNFMAETKNFPERFPSALMMCFVYLQKLVLPHPLVSDMGYPQVKLTNWSDWKALAGLFTYFGMGIYAIYGLIKRHFMAYPIWFYLITFSLFSNVLVLIGTSYGERLMYAPSFGFALALAWLLHKVLGQFNSATPANTTTLWAVVGGIAVLYGLKTIDRNGAWKDSYHLYEADYPTSPNCAKLNYHRSLEITKYGMDENTGAVINEQIIRNGIAAYNRTIELYPQYHDAYGSRGLAYFRLKEYDKAYDDYQVALKYRPNDAKVLSNMGFIYFLRAQRPGNQLATAQLDSAENVYRRSIQYDPRFVDARRNLGAVMAMKKNFPAAIEQWKEGLKFVKTNDDNYILNFYIGSAYKDMGDPMAAQPWFDKAARYKGQPQGVQQAAGGGALGQ